MSGDSCVTRRTKKTHGISSFELSKRSLNLDFQGKTLADYVLKRPESMGQMDSLSIHMKSYLSDRFQILNFFLTNPRCFEFDVLINIHGPLLCNPLLLSPGSHPYQTRCPDRKKDTHSNHCPHTFLYRQCQHGFQGFSIEFGSDLQ